MNLALPIVFLLLVLASPLLGVDSRREDSRGWWPGRASRRR